MSISLKGIKILHFKEDCKNIGVKETAKKYGIQIDRATKIFETKALETAPIAEFINCKYCNFESIEEKHLKENIKKSPSINDDLIEYVDLYGNEREIEFPLFYIYELRHACNVLGIDFIARKLKVSPELIEKIYELEINGSHGLIQFLKADEKEFEELRIQYTNEDEEKMIEKMERSERQYELICDLKDGRKNFAGIGTNKAKRRLNKLAKTSILAKAIRVALEAEDKNISAKECSYPNYKEKIYRSKEILLLELCGIFKSEGWVYGIQGSDITGFYLLYFEIPGCEQISWHVDNGIQGEFPKYEKEWDGKVNSTLGKLEDVTKKMLEENGLLGK